jgi:hypothetical protein
LKTYNKTFFVFVLQLFFEGNPDYHKPTDKIENLDRHLLQEEAATLSYFLLATEDPSFLV